MAAEDTLGSEEIPPTLSESAQARLADREVPQSGTEDGRGSRDEGRGLDELKGELVTGRKVGRWEGGAGKGILKMGYRR